jgi:EAL domain-containing protein (putative c-di-GMP-specific phosphodiesterase class I)
MEISTFMINAKYSLEENLSLNQIVPYFQPIISLEDKSIFGYEALGRMVTPNGDVVSLGEFFTKTSQSLGNEPNKSDLNALRSRIDRDLRTKSFYRILEDTNPHSKIFLNVSPKSMYWHLKNNPEETPLSIQLCRKLDINPRRIVIEITEDDFEENIDFLAPLIKLYRETGFLVAIDDVGSKSSNLDRIGTFHPDIVKIDMQMLKKSMFNRNYSEILYNISQLAQSLGISLLFEGIETKEEMNKALSFGARYVQGYLFSQAREKLLEKNAFADEINQLINYFYFTKHEEIKSRSDWENRIEQILQKIPLEEKLENTGEVKDILEIFNIDSAIRRFYVTDIYGNQKTPNFIKKNEQLVLVDPLAKNKNWSWRPYFLNHIYNSYRHPENWVISQPYMDVSENVLFRTFSKTIDQSIIFIDVFYNE